MTLRSVLGLWVLLAVSGLAAANGSPLVAAAADLQFALTEIAAQFEHRTQQSVRVAFGSSGNLARQIRQGAPFELYLSADEQYALDLAREGLTEGEGALYGEGRLVILIPPGSPLRADGSLDDLRAALTDGRLSRFAIANPEHAPYGQRAAEALRHRGLWEPIRARLVMGENAAQAAQFATSGSTEGGITAYALALTPQLAARGTFALIPAEWHAPLYQRMVLLKRAGPVARDFYHFVQGPEARAILERNGFRLPAEGSAPAP